MSKNFVFRLVLGLVAVVAAVLWLLSVVMEETFGWFSLGWAVVIIAGACGIAFVFRGLLGKTVALPLKKLNIYFGAGFILMAIIALIGELAMDNKLILPIIAVVVTCALLLGYVAVGGKKWDGGDNQKAGYKNYYERKAEEEKNADKENKD